MTASAFSIVVLGGLGSVSGSLIAAYVVGYLETMTAYLVSPAYRTIPALLLLVFVMYVSATRPPRAALTSMRSRFRRLDKAALSGRPQTGVALAEAIDLRSRIPSAAAHDLLARVAAR